MNHTTDFELLKILASQPMLTAHEAEVMAQAEAAFRINTPVEKPPGGKTLPRPPRRPRSQGRELAC